MFRSDRTWFGWTIVQNKTAPLALRLDHTKNLSTLTRFIIYPIILCHSTRHMMGKKSMYRFFFLSYYSWERSVFLNKTRKAKFIGPPLFLWRLTIYVQMLDLSFPNDSPCWKTSKSKISAHLNMSVKNGQGAVSQNFIG